MDGMMNPQAQQQTQISPEQQDAMRKQMMLQAMMKQQGNGAPAMTAGAGAGNALAQGLMGYMQGANMRKMGYGIPQQQYPAMGGNSLPLSNVVGTPQAGA